MDLHAFLQQSWTGLLPTGPVSSDYYILQDNYLQNLIPASNVCTSLSLLFQVNFGLLRVMCRPASLTKQLQMMLVDASLSPPPHPTPPPRSPCLPSSSLLDNPHRHSDSPCVSAGREHHPPPASSAAQRLFVLCGLRSSVSLQAPAMLASNRVVGWGCFQRIYVLLFI